MTTLLNLPSSVALIHLWSWTFHHALLKKVWKEAEELLKSNPGKLFLSPGVPTRSGALKGSTSIPTSLRSKRVDRFCVKTCVCCTLRARRVHTQLPLHIINILSNRI